MKNTSQAQVLLHEAMAQNLYKNLIIQLNKDFTRAAIDENFSDDTVPKSLVRRLVAVIYELITDNFESYLNFLYAVDVPERLVKELPEQEVDEVAHAVTLLILKREWQKVWYKNRH